MQRTRCRAQGGLAMLLGFSLAPPGKEQRAQSVLRQLQFLPTHLCLDRCDSESKVYFSKSQPRFWKLKGHY